MTWESLWDIFCNENNVYWIAPQTFATIGRGALAFGTAMLMKEYLIKAIVEPTRRASSTSVSIKIATRPDPKCLAASNLKLWKKVKCNLVHFIYLHHITSKVDLSSSYHENLIFFILAKKSSYCVADSGPDTWGHCAFPFKYKGQMFDGCITYPNKDKAWCSTWDEYKSGKWGNCPSYCRLGETNQILWRQEKTGLG